MIPCKSAQNPFVMITAEAQMKKKRTKIDIEKKNCKTVSFLFNQFCNPITPFSLLIMQVFVIFSLDFAAISKKKSSALPSNTEKNGLNTLNRMFLNMCVYRNESVTKEKVTTHSKTGDSLRANTNLGNTTLAFFLLALSAVVCAAACMAKAC